MVHMPHLNLLVVHGGRTSKNVRVSPENKLQNFLNPNSNYKSEISEAPKMNFTLGDLYALKLDNLEWIKVISPNEDKLARSNHWLAKIGKESLLIFGGNAINSTYCSSDYIISFTDENL